MPKPIITGYYGCSCHPFSSWEECKKAHKQKLEIGTPVRHRCTGLEGFIHEVNEDYFYVVKCGILPRDNHGWHSAGLKVISKLKSDLIYEELVQAEKAWLIEHRKKPIASNKAKGYA